MKVQNRLTGIQLSGFIPFLVERMTELGFTGLCFLYSYTNIAT